MKRKNLKKIVTASYNTNNQLDETNVEQIATYLTRSELKEYIRALKLLEKRKQLVVDTSFRPTKVQEDMLRNQFPDKEVLFHLDPELILGIKITDNDIVYNMNLRRTLDAIERYIDEQYD